MSTARIHRDEAVRFAAMIEAGQTSEEIAGRFNQELAAFGVGEAHFVTARNVRLAARRMGAIEPRPSGRPRKAAGLGLVYVDDLSSGLSAAAVGRKHGVSGYVVLAEARRVGWKGKV